jgi:PAS domain S-box-containing protein
MPTRLELYQRVAPLAGLGIWEQNLDTGEAFWNDITCKILEIERGETPRLSEVLKMHEEPERLKAFLDGARWSTQSRIEDFQITTAKGNKKWIRLRVQCYFEKGKCQSIYGTVEDITDNVKLLDELQEKERRFSKAFDHAPIGMALVSPDGRWLKVNNSICNILGYTPEDLIHNTFQSLTHPDDLAADLEQMSRLLAGEIERYSMEKRYFKSDGSLIWAVLSVSLVRDTSGEPLYFVSQVRDVSQRRRNMQIISEQNTRLLNFAHIISHNLRSHTGNIRMLTSLVLEETDDVEKNKLIEMLEINAGNLLETLDNLNEVVKIQDDGMANMADLNLSQQVYRTLDILSASIRKFRATIDVAIEKNLTVKYNPAYLESILINLVTNSLKYSDPERPLAIGISAIQRPNFIELKVADNGLGIDLNLHGHKLFGMYKTFHKHEEARGMGLFLVKNHVEAMGGTIYATSEPGKGSSFTIEIPINNE